MKLKAIFTSVIGVLLLASCSNMVITMDNPTDKEMTVLVDGKEYKLAPGELQKIDIDKGEHAIKVNDQAERKINLDIDHGMINLVNEPYYVVTVPYGGNSSAELEAKKDTITFEGDQYEGPFEIREGDVIYTGDLNFTANEPLKDEIETSKAGVVLRTKLFRKADFKKYLED